ncbi:MAG: hypothetical protein Q4B85_12815 [Lachnospiraceae bacterium]|nr:hypothetical protein [Lachnospiraceae bacterium]
MGKILISEELFSMLVKYHCFGYVEDERIIKRQLEEKMEAIDRRILYSKYKTAKDPDVQETARREYLEKKRLQNNF